MYPVIQIDPTQSESPESLGTKRKFWFRDRGGTRWLFKAEERGTGEDWSEKVSCELAALLGLPHVHYELAEETVSRTPGVICQSMATGSNQLVLGNQLLLERDHRYPAADVAQYKVRAHSVEAVVAVLKGLGAPTADWCEHLPAGVESALDIFVGYAMFDALVSNQDRHHENWGALRIEGELQLAPSFDHGASLARNLSDRERKDRLESKDGGYQVPSFASRARSAFYDSESTAKAMLTFDAWESFAAQASLAASQWRERLSAVGVGEINAILQKIPPDRLSVIAKQFTVALLLENRRRIVEGVCT